MAYTASCGDCGGGGDEVRIVGGPWLELKTIDGGAGGDGPAAFTNAEEEGNAGGGLGGVDGDSATPKLACSCDSADGSEGDSAESDAVAPLTGGPCDLRSSDVFLITLHVGES